eukprot:TRINITY_DN3727_c0_g1_i2.p1 TRINITY_DN3727_c0_g1~~TRINITY_DN3727_c0_g1_i2.p1  ORF type:complete len:864 (-),score=149.89 TRINITY_DN3727_c0_g1_i2:265-2856(-)
MCVPIEHPRTGRSVASIFTPSTKTDRLVVHRFTMTSYRYFVSKDIDLNVRLKIENLEGDRSRHDVLTLLETPELAFSGLYAGSPFSDLYVTCDLYCYGQPVGPSSSTSYHPFAAQPRWNEWLSLPCKYRDLPLDAQLVITIWDIYGPGKVMAVGGTSLSLFSKSGKLRKGRQKLLITRDVQGTPFTGEGSGAPTPGKRSRGGPMEALEKVIKRYDRGEVPRVPWLDQATFRQIERMNQENGDNETMFLFVELPTFEYPVHFQPQDSEVARKKEAATATTSRREIQDPQMGMENPVEQKYHRLARSLRRGLVDRNLKPSAQDRKEIARIMAASPIKPLSVDDKDILWKYRFSLVHEKKALTKFLKSVDWTDRQEAKQAAELLRDWARPDFDDALELLSSQFHEGTVRGYAVDLLSQASDDALLTFLLQLVQALRYEDLHSSSGEAAQDSPLADFLVQRGVDSSVVGNYLYWYLTVEISETKVGRMFEKIRMRFIQSLMKTEEGRARADVLSSQEKLIAQLVAIANQVKTGKNENRTKRIERLRGILAQANGSGGASNYTVKFPVNLPLAPEVLASSFIPEEASIFASALKPLRLAFRTREPVDRGLYTVIFKSGDDLRQDQLVIQIISLMDKLLKRENLDLRLTPYRVLATSATHGFVEFVPSKSMAAVLAESKGNILDFFAKHHPDESRPYGVAPEVLDTFVKSCAGYCVITYLLGIGDRHLDNLMLTTQGHLFHVDFGYILGRDPKPLPPPMKLCKEMVEGMGGATSPDYNRFKLYCCEAFNILRKSAPLITNLFILMSDAKIPDVGDDPAKIVVKLLDKFCVEMSDEEAVQYFQSLINESVSALFPQMVETIHRWAQYWRS